MRMGFKTSVFFGWVLCLHVACTAGPTGAPLFISGEGGYDTYRIPALAVTTEGTVLAFC